jgi:L-iditol 2-dehydrogenase
VCALLGAATVILVGTRKSRLDLGRALGARHTVNAAEVNAVDAVLELTDGRGVDLAIEASGAVEVPQQCADVTKRGGKILFVAFYPEPVRLDLSGVVRKDITMFTSRGEGRDNVRRAVALAADGRLRGGELVTHHFPLADIAEAFRVLRVREGDPVKVVVVP